MRLVRMLRVLEYIGHPAAIMSAREQRQLKESRVLHTREGKVLIREALIQESVCEIDDQWNQIEAAIAMLEDIGSVDSQAQIEEVIALLRGTLHE